MAMKIVLVSLIEILLLTVFCVRSSDIQVNYIVFSSPGNLFQHASKDDHVNGKQAVPVDQARQTNRIKDRGLPNGRALVVWLYFKFQPRSPGYLHFCGELQAMVGFVFFDSPPIQYIADSQMIGIPPRAALANPTNDEVNPTPDRPEEVGTIPTSVTLRCGGSGQKPVSAPLRP